MIKINAEVHHVQALAYSIRECPSTYCPHCCTRQIYSFAKSGSGFSGYSEFYACLGCSNVFAELPAGRSAMGAENALIVAAREALERGKEGAE